MVVIQRKKDRNQQGYDGILSMTIVIVFSKYFWGTFKQSYLVDGVFCYYLKVFCHDSGC